MTVPRHAPWLHVSLPLHALPSLHAWPSAFVNTQPVFGSQESVVHALLSSQASAGPAVHNGPAHLSAVVQALPSSQLTTVSACKQPVVVLQLSAVQLLPSSQLVARPDLQLPLMQLSLAVHASPSEQPPVSGSVTQPSALVQRSVVQALLSLQTIAVPAQAPVAHVSPFVHASPSSQVPV